MGYNICVHYRFGLPFGGSKEVRMSFPWKFLIDLGIISLALLAATYIRVRIRFFQKYLIPNALTAGFLLLLFYNFAAPLLGLSADGLGAMVYHLLSLSFIAMTLRRSPPRTGRDRHGILSTAVAVVFQYGLQASVGLLLTFFFIVTFFPDLFPSMGFFIPLGFALGPGQAYAIGEGWRAFGFGDGGSVGLTFAAIGFLFACFGGVWLINYGIRREWISAEKRKVIEKQGVRTGVYSRQSTKPSGMYMTTENEAIDSLSYTAGMVFVVYLLSYLELKLITYLLSFIGPLGEELAVNLWGLNFVFAALTAILVKVIIGKLGIQYTLDNQALNRVAGFSVDLMVSAAVGAISLVVVMKYWIPITVMALIGGFLVLATVPWFCSRIFRDHRFDRLMIIYGGMTGTMPTGLALLRVIDPDFETPAASDYMFSTAVVFAVCIPFILAINLPAYTFTTGNFLYFWLGFGVSFAYLLAGLVGYLLLARKRAFRFPRSPWLPDEDE
jgi:ESS family glutamate:Na+ symporter